MQDAPALNLAKILSAERRARAEGPNARGRIRVAFGGDCTLDNLAAAASHFARARAIEIEPDILSFDGWTADVLNPNFAADLAVIWVSALGLSAGGTRREVDDKLDDIVLGLKALNDKGVKTILLTPERMAEEVEPGSPWASWRRRVKARLEPLEGPRLTFLDPDIFAPEGGFKDFRWWTQAKIIGAPDDVIPIARALADTLANLRKHPVKAILVDADDTLWGGVLGEVGVEGVLLNPAGAGAAFLRLQHYLKDALLDGVALGVASKNDPGSVAEVLDRRMEMVLKRSDFLFIRDDWTPKYLAAVAFCEQLNIGTDALVFLDDNPHERAEMRAMLPDVIVPDLSADPHERARFLSNLSLIRKPTRSQEDQARISYFKQDIERAHAQKSAQSRDDYLRSLNINLNIEPIDGSNLPRVTDLIHKTNQFNLTCRRHNPTELQQFLAPPHYARAFHVTDRFGPAGLVGVILAARNETVLEIDTWLLSCRVLGRTVEEGMLAHLIDWARHENVATLRGRFVAHKRNAQVADIYPRMGFQLSSNHDMGTGQVYDAQIKQLNLPKTFVRFVEPSSHKELLGD